MVEDDLAQAESLLRNWLAAADSGAIEISPTVYPKDDLRQLQSETRKFVTRAD